MSATDGSLVLVDFELLLTTLLREGLPGATVVPATSADTVPGTGLVVITPINGRRFGSGPAGLGFEWDVAITCVASTHEGAADLSSDVYQLMQSFQARAAKVPGVGSVARVEDVSLPVRTATTALNTQNLTQYDATFTVVVRPA